MKRVNIDCLSVVGVGVVGNSVVAVDIEGVDVEGVDVEGVGIEGVSVERVEVFRSSVPIVPLSSSTEEQRSGSIAAVVLRKLDSQRGNMNMSMVRNFCRCACRPLYSSNEPEDAQPMLIRSNQTSSCFTERFLHRIGSLCKANRQMGVHIFFVWFIC